MTTEAVTPATAAVTSSLYRRRPTSVPAIRTGTASASSRASPSSPFSMTGKALEELGEIGGRAAYRAGVGGGEGDGEAERTVREVISRATSAGWRCHRSTAPV